MADRIEDGKRYHCRELNTPRQRTGVFWCDDEGMRVQLFDYEMPFHLDRAPLHLQLENNLIVSMHNIVPMGAGHSSYLHDPPTTTYYGGALANTLVVGHRRWLASDPIRRVLFSVPHTKGLLAHQPKLKAVRAKRFPSAAATEPLFEVAAAGIIVRCWYTLNGSWEFGTNDWEPLYEIEFDEPKNLQTYLDSVHIVLRFLSAAAGFKLSPSKIAISSLSHAESLASINVPRDDAFSVEYLWSEAIIDQSDLHAGNSFVVCLDRLELAAFKLCLKAWLIRNGEWEKATTLMMGSLGSVHETSGQRLLMACRWLEAIPDNTVASAVSKADIDVIVDEATRAARALGHSTLDKRIRGSLRSIAREANKDRFERLLSTVEMAFGKSVLTDVGMPGSTVGVLMQALNYRGQEAHSLISESAADFRSLYVALTGMEALCYLLTLKDLPMNDNGRRRTLASRVVRAHQYARLDDGG